MRDSHKEFVTRFKTLLHCRLDIFDQTWAEIAADYAETAPTIIEYVRNEWIDGLQGGGV